MATNSEFEEEEGAEENNEKLRVREKELIKKKRECNSRIDELAKPKRWLLLGTYKCYGYLFDPQRMQSIKERVQELFSMSPEETELYFNTLRLKKPKRIDYKALRRKIKKEKAKARREAYQLFHRLLKKAMKYAYKHAPPLLVTPMLRIVSDHVLEVLSELHKVDVPKRTNTDNLSQFLITISDWTAIFVANIYYEIEVEDRNDIDRIQQLNRIKSESSVVAPSSRKTSSTGVTELQTGVTNYEQEGEAEHKAEGQVLEPETDEDVGEG